MFIQTETTADPAAIKFLPGREVLSSGTLTLRNREEATDIELVQRLFDISGVAEVTLGVDYVIVTAECGDWEHLRPRILDAMVEHFTEEACALVADTGVEPGGAATRALGDLVVEALRRVIDPELGENIVDLGLVYDVEAQAGSVRVTMTTTTPGCPAMTYLVEGARDAALSVPQVELVDVKLTYQPRWTSGRISPEAKARLGIGE